MDLSLSWDLLTIVFFGVVITYSLIIGKRESVTIIVATYIAIVAVEGLGGVMERLSPDSGTLLASLGITMQVSLLSAAQLLLFVTLIVFLAVRGGIGVEYEREWGGIVDTALTAVYGFLTAGLLLSALLTFVTDLPLLDTNAAASPTTEAIVESSDIMKVVVEYRDAWFALPALVLLAVGLLSNRENGD